MKQLQTQLREAIGLPVEVFPLPVCEPQISTTDLLRCDAWLYRKRSGGAADPTRVLELLLNDSVRVGGPIKSRLKRPFGGW